MAVRVRSSRDGAVTSGNASGSSRLLFALIMALYLGAGTLLLPIYVVLYLAVPVLRGAFGLRFLPFLKARSGRGTFVHAASTGEAALAWKLFGDRAAYTWFNNGARDLLQRQGAWAVPLPPDSVLPLLLFFARHRPATLVLVEQEVWPALMVTARLFGTRLVLLNGLMYRRSFPAQKRFRALYGPLFSLFGVRILQTDEDARLLGELGCPSRGSVVAGNYKLCLPPDFTFRAPRAVEGAPLAVFASAHPGEYGLFTEAMRRGSTSFRQAIAPIRVDTVRPLVAAMESAGLAPLLLSETGLDLDRALAALGGQASARVLVLDRVGFLGPLYGHASVAVVGGSFNGAGGQDFAEPLRAGVPVVLGPSWHNFEPVHDAFGGAGILVPEVPPGYTAPSPEDGLVAGRIADLCARAVRPEVRRDMAGELEAVFGRLRLASERQRALLAEHIPCGAPTGAGSRNLPSP